MKKAVVRRTELLEKVTANRDKHIAEYKEAVETYRVEAEKLVEAKAKEASKAYKELLQRVKETPADQIPKLWINPSFIGFTELPVPISHVRDYNQVVAMLEMDTRETIELEADQFAYYVLDDWDWKKQFESVNSFYTLRKSVGTK